MGGPFTHKAKSLRVMAAVRAGNGVVGEDDCEPSAQVLGKLPGHQMIHGESARGLEGSSVQQHPP